MKRGKYGTQVDGLYANIQRAEKALHLEAELNYRMALDTLSQYAEAESAQGQMPLGKHKINFIPTAMEIDGRSLKKTLFEKGRFKDYNLVTDGFGIWAEQPGLALYRAKGIQNIGAKLSREWITVERQTFDIEESAAAFWREANLEEIRRQIFAHFGYPDQRPTPPKAGTEQFSEEVAAWREEHEKLVGEYSEIESQIFERAFEAVPRNLGHSLMRILKFIHYNAVEIELLRAEEDGGAKIRLQYGKFRDMRWIIDDAIQAEEILLGVEDIQKLQNATRAYLESLFRTQSVRPLEHPGNPRLNLSYCAFRYVRMGLDDEAKAAFEGELMLRNFTFLYHKILKYEELCGDLGQRVASKADAYGDFIFLDKFMRARIDLLRQAANAIIELDTAALRLRKKGHEKAAHRFDKASALLHYLMMDVGNAASGNKMLAEVKRQKEFAEAAGISQDACSARILNFSERIGELAVARKHIVAHRKEREQIKKKRGELEKRQMRAAKLLCGLCAPLGIVYKEAYEDSKRHSQYTHRERTPDTDVISALTIGEIMVRLNLRANELGDKPEQKMGVTKKEWRQICEQFGDEKTVLDRTLAEYAGQAFGNIVEHMARHPDSIERWELRGQPHHFEFEKSLLDMAPSVEGMISEGFTNKKYEIQYSANINGEAVAIDSNTPQGMHSMPFSSGTDKAQLRATLAASCPGGCPEEPTVRTISREELAAKAGAPHVGDFKPIWDYFINMGVLFDRMMIQMMEDRDYHVSLLDQMQNGGAICATHARDGRQKTLHMRPEGTNGPKFKQPKRKRADEHRKTAYECEHYLVLQRLMRKNAGGMETRIAIAGWPRDKMLPKKLF